MTRYNFGDILLAEVPRTDFQGVFKRPAPWCYLMLATMM